MPQGTYRVFHNPYPVVLEGLETESSYCQGLRGCDSIKEVPQGVEVIWSREEGEKRYTRTVLFLQGVLDGGWQEDAKEKEAEWRAKWATKIAASTDEPPPKKPPKKRAKRGKRGGGSGAPANA